jgi:hypothetical protein
MSAAEPVLKWNRVGDPVIVETSQRVSLAHGASTGTASCGQDPSAVPERFLATVVSSAVICGDYTPVVGIVWTKSWISR